MIEIIKAKINISNYHPSYYHFVLRYNVTFSTLMFILEEWRGTWEKWRIQMSLRLRLVVETTNTTILSSCHKTFEQITELKCSLRHFCPFCLWCSTLPMRSCVGLIRLRWDCWEHQWFQPSLRLKIIETELCRSFQISSNNLSIIS